MVRVFGIYANGFCSRLLWQLFLLVTGVTTLLSGTASAQLFIPPKAGAPRTSVGAGTRSPFPVVEQQGRSVMPVLPKAQIGSTVSSHPSLFVYVPESSARRVFFSIKDESGMQHHQARLQLPQGSGIAKVTVPETAPPLEIGKKYVWFLVFIGEEQLKPDSPMITGWIERREPMNDLTGLVSLDYAADLGRAGLWYDMIAVLARLKQKHPEDPVVLQAWKTELTSAGLAEIVGQPFLD
ncbi:MAG: DUF928 domain-containing protein [Microcoleaceae cyanobacterium]